MGNVTQPELFEPQARVGDGKCTGSQGLEDTAVDSAPSDGCVIEVIQHDPGAPIDARQLEELDQPFVVLLEGGRQPDGVTVDAEVERDWGGAQGAIDIPLPPPLVDRAHHSAPRIRVAETRFEQLDVDSDREQMDATRVHLLDLLSDQRRGAQNHVEELQLIVAQPALDLIPCPSDDTRSVGRTRGMKGRHHRHDPVQ